MHHLWLGVDILHGTCMWRVHEVRGSRAAGSRLVGVWALTADYDVYGKHMLLMPYAWMAQLVRAQVSYLRMTVHDG